MPEQTFSTPVEILLEDVVLVRHVDVRNTVWVFKVQMPDEEVRRIRLELGDRHRKYEIDSIKLGTKVTLKVDYVDWKIGHLEGRSYIFKEFTS